MAHASFVLYLMYIILDKARSILDESDHPDRMTSTFLDKFQILFQENRLSQIRL